MIVSVMGDRHDSAPFGLDGGGSAEPNDILFHVDGEDRIPPMRTKLARQTLTDGDWLTVSSPGGGGHGDPLTRPTAEVERDLNLGYITPESAEQDFGVVIAERWTVGGHDRFRLDPQRSGQRAAPAAALVEAD
jgi:N-methylhydantoinase B